MQVSSFCRTCAVWMKGEDGNLIQIYFLSIPVTKLSFTSHFRHQEPKTHLVFWGKIFLCNLICLALTDKGEKREPFFSKRSDHIYALFLDIIFFVNVHAKVHCFMALKAFQAITIIWRFLFLLNIKQVRLLQHLLNFSYHK